MTIVRRRAPTETVIEIDGAFDPASASSLKELVDEAATESSVTLDFREVRLFHDSAIAQLAAALSSRPNVRLLGLSQHHYRLLRYVGEPGLAGAAAHQR